MSKFIVPMLAVFLSANVLSQPPSTNSDSQRSVVMRVGSPGVELQGFYGSIRSFFSVMRSTRVAGRGWSLPQSDRKAWNKGIEIALAKREAFMDEAAKLSESTDEFWSRVITSEMESQRELESILEEALPPDEVEAYITEHARDLGECIISSKAFFKKAKVDEKIQKTMEENRRKGLEVMKNMVQGKPSPGSLSVMSNIKDLEAEQVRLLLVLQGRMESNTTLEDHFAIVSEQERDFFINNVPKLREYLTAKKVVK